MNTGAAPAVPATGDEFPPLGPAIRRRHGDAPYEEPQEGRTPGSPGASAAAAAEPGSLPPLSEVADRLERIAARIRGRSAADLIDSLDETDGDPLEILLVGYALGYAQRAQAPNGGDGDR